jgi:predicted GTPase
MKAIRTIIMGAAGRDFHNFNVLYRDNDRYDVVAFTATQIPNIDGRRYPAALAGRLYPNGIPIHPESELAALVTTHGVDEVVFSYSDVSHLQVMHTASLCLSLGADFVLLGPERTSLRSTRPVISVCAVRTGSGKSGVTKYVLDIVKSKGIKPVSIRHPMPYCDLETSRSRRFEKPEDLDIGSCTIEEREEFEPLIEAGGVVYSGVDMAEVLRHAEQEADLIIWDGGNNDLPFIKPDLEIVVFDPHRPGHELLYHAGEANLRRAEIAVVNKVNTASDENIAVVEENIRRINPAAIIVRTHSQITVENQDQILGRRVLVVEDGPTLTHGGMPYGSGFLAAKEYGAKEIVDPRPFAIGEIREAFVNYPHLSKVLPAVGYSPKQIDDLRETIESTPCDLVLIATPVDLRKLLLLSRDSLRVRYEIREPGRAALKDLVDTFLAKRFPAL